MAQCCKDCPKMSRPTDPKAKPVCTDLPNGNYAREARNIVTCHRYRLHLHNYAKSYEARS